MKLGQLIHGLAIRPVTPGASDVRITDITEDSRTVMPGSLFVARPGTKADGRQFALDAAHAGASAILIDDPAPLTQGHSCPNVAVLAADHVTAIAAEIAERFYGSPSTNLDVVGVTGTNGKTTVTWLTWQILNAVGRRCGLIGTVVIDDGREVASAAMTTPPALEISRTLATMVESGCQAVVLEASSHALDQNRVSALHFDVAVFTNLTRDHLDYHKTMDAYAVAKARLFAMLPADGSAIVNADSPPAADITRNCRAPVLRCGLRDASHAPNADSTVQILSATLAGMTLKLTGPWGTIEQTVPLIGTYNAMNVLQAVAACHALGVEPASIQAALASVTAPAGRLERVSTSHDSIHVFVDFAHTDDGLISVLQAARSVMTSGKLWVVFGCGGNKDQGKRPKMGKAAAELADCAVITSDNPRTERPGDIIDMILAGIAPELRGRVTIQADRAQAINHAVSHAATGDLIILAGKGHETEQILPNGTGGTTTIEFDDRLVAKDALKRRRHAPVQFPTNRAPAQAD